MAYKRIYSTCRQQDLAFIKSILDAADIDYYVNEGAAGAYPLGINMELFAIESQEKEAKELIKDFTTKTK